MPGRKELWNGSRAETRQYGDRDDQIGRFGQLVTHECHGGGVQDSRSVKAIMPAGASSSLIVVNDEKVLDTPMDYATVRTLGADLGSASVIIIDDTVSLEWLVNKTVHFFRHESCGKCTPCREGTYWMSNITERIRSGQGTSGDVDLLLNVAKQIQGKCLCALGEFSTMAVVTGIERFPQDFRNAVQPAPSPAILENQRA